MGTAPEMKIGLVIPRIRFVVVLIFHNNIKYF